MSLRKLPDALQKVANEELNEDSLRIKSDWQHIKEWLKKQPHLNACTDDQFLVAFLRGTKFSLEKTKQKLDMYYTMKTLLPEVFTHRRPSSAISQKILDVCPLVPLPKLPHPNSPRYFLVRFNVIDRYKLDVIEVFKVLTMINNINFLDDDNAMVAGTIALLCYSGTTLDILKWSPPSLTKKGFILMQHAYPYRIESIHLFNVPTFMDIILTVFKPFLTAKNKSRMKVHSNVKDLCKMVPLEILPEEYGGQGGKIDDILQAWKGKLLTYEDWFIEDEKRKSDESKRMGEPQTEESVLGIQGSFRQLAVD